MLPSCFKPEKTYDLIRLGRKYDGGYLVERKSVNDADALLSFGLDNDWSFEHDFIAENNVPIDAYDHTVSTPIFINRVITTLFSTIIGIKHIAYYVRELKSNLKASLTFARFFRNTKRFHKTAVCNGRRESKTLTEIINSRPDPTTFFIKCDIEGCEYRMLGELISHADRICGLAIELHNVDIHLHKITEFIKNFPLTLVHIHANNYGGQSSDGTPLVIELSFARSPSPIQQQSTVPHINDMINDPYREDIMLQFPRQQPDSCRDY